MRAAGVDVSHWKPVKDWQALAASGVSFIGIKATEGNHYTDDTLQSHVRGFRGSSLALGFYYHFPRPGSAEKQAQRLIAEVTRMEGLRPNERLALDVEGAGPTEDPKDAIGWIDEFFKTIHKATGRYPLLYTSARIWRKLGNPSWELAPKVDLWLPRWSSGEKEPELPGPWATIPSEVEVFAHGKFEPAKAKVDKQAGTITLTYSNNTQVRKIADEGVYWKRKVPGWAFWQWTDGKQPIHETPGIGKCDANWFRGTVDELRAYVATPAS
jgi:hypothetical protein